MILSKAEVDRMKPDERLPDHWFRIVREKVSWFVIDDLNSHLIEPATSQNGRSVAEASPEGSKLDAEPPES